MTSLVKMAHGYLEERSCLKFHEIDPRVVANRSDFTYIYYYFSGALENCCLKHYDDDLGRRMVLITPICRMPAEIAHVVLHALGVTHIRREPFNELAVRAKLFPSHVLCKNKLEKLRMFALD
ncbi:uncharacterized protein LOC142978987 isoform X2 [Anticarsia gemmatalis]